MSSTTTAKVSRKRLAAASASSLALVLAFVPAASSAAAQGPPRTAHGTGFITSLEETSSREAGGNRIAERVIHGEMSGPLTGSFTETVRGVIHRDGTVTFQGTMTFSGTLEGCGAGTLVGRLAGRGEAGPSPVTDATIALVNQQSATIDAAGQGRVHQDGALLTYEVTYVCR